eukprot:scaffold10746_cov76-Skeletonema_dohrnii-CCMP3373.AAC.4
MDFDSEFQNDCAFPSLKTEMEAQAQRPRRSVSFQPMSALYLYEAPEPEDDFTLWRTQEDEELSKANARLELSLLKQMQRGEAPGGSRSLNADDLTTVGLEKYLVSPEFTMKRARFMRLNGLLMPRFDFRSGQLNRQGSLVKSNTGRAECRFESVSLNFDVQTTRAKAVGYIASFFWSTDLLLAAGGYRALLHCSFGSSDTIDNEHMHTPTIPTSLKSYSYNTHIAKCLNSVTNPIIVPYD